MEIISNFPACSSGDMSQPQMSFYGLRFALEFSGVISYSRRRIIVDAVCSVVLEMFGHRGLRSDSPVAKGVDFFPPQLYSRTSPKTPNGNAEIRRAAVCVSHGARKRARVIGDLASPYFSQTLPLVRSLTSKCCHASSSKVARTSKRTTRS